MTSVILQQRFLFAKLTPIRCDSREPERMHSRRFDWASVFRCNVSKLKPSYLLHILFVASCPPYLFRSLTNVQSDSNGKERTTLSTRTPGSQDHECKNTAKISNLFLSIPVACDQESVFFGDSNPTDPNPAYGHPDPRKRFREVREGLREASLDSTEGGGGSSLVAQTFEYAKFQYILRIQRHGETLRLQ